MTWLIKLYPPAWRRRYGRELSDLIAAQPASVGTAIDLVAGAIDAWFNPQSSTAAAIATRTARMFIRQRCAVLNRHKMRTAIQCDTHEWRPRARGQGQIDSVKPR